MSMEHVWQDIFLAAVVEQPDHHCSDDIVLKYVALIRLPAAMLYLHIGLFS